MGKHGYSIISDGWTHTRNKSIINFMVNYYLGSMFIESIDESSFAKSNEKTFELLDRFIEQIKENNVVQVITNNGNNYVLVGK
jgi:hypothetical protein